MDSDSVKLAVVCSEFNGEITDRMLNSALTRCKQSGIDVRYVCRVPGAFDIPLFVKELLSKDDVDAVVTLGAIVTGDTKHDEVIASQLAAAIAQLSVTHGKPVSLGVSGPGMKWEQGVERADEYAARAVDAAVKMVSGIRQLRKDRAERDYPAIIE